MQQPGDWVLQIKATHRHWMIGTVEGWKPTFLIKENKKC